MMKIMRIYLILLFSIMIVLMPGCKQSTNLTEYIVDKETAKLGQELQLGVEYCDRLCGEFNCLIDGVKRTEPIDHKFYLDDDLLQESAKTCIEDAPIDTDEEITRYAWSILPFLIESKYLPEDWEPVAANQYLGNIWLIFFTEGGYADYSMRDGTKDVYVSGEDGHIILITGQGKLQSTTER